MKLVHVKEKGIKKDEMFVIGFGDLHYGSIDCDYPKIEETIKWIKSKDNARVVLMGDLVDIGLKDSVGGGTFDNDHTPEKQIEDIITMLDPIKDKIWCLLTGNHEERIRQRTSINISKIIAKTLDVPYCDSACFIKVLFGTQNYIMFVTHGSSGALTASGKLNSVLKYGGYIDADVYMSGHVHELMHHTTDYFKISLKDKMVIKDKRHYVLSGHFLKYGGYAEQKGYAPGKTGVAKIILRKDKKSIHVSI